MIFNPPSSALIKEQNLSNETWQTFSDVLFATGGLIGIANAEKLVCNGDGSSIDTAVCVQNDFARADAQLNDT
jgi:uncharacterized protein YecT (DUF1311 family)